MVTADAVKSAKIVVPGAEVDDSPLPLEAVTAFPKLQWTGWSGETPEGKVVHHRPIVLTHAGDGSNRVFVATEHGVIHVFPNDPNAEKTEIFLDIQDRVRYSDKRDEEGFLGLTFHPRYKENGEFFVFYTVKQAKHPTQRRLAVPRSQRDPNQADPASEEVLLTIEHPFWNHDGGTMAFGPDGYLYIAVGDGGLAADPFRNGQNLGKRCWEKSCGSTSTIKTGRRPTRFPRTILLSARRTPRPEIWCYGLRNVWRFSFDRETHVGWASDVGQNLWEEINLMVAGGNYGWNVREALAPVRGEGRRAAEAPDRSHLGIPSQHRQIDHGGRRLSREACSPSCEGPTSTPTTSPGRSLPCGMIPPRNASSPTSRSARRSCRSSPLERTRRGRCTSSASRPTAAASHASSGRSSRRREIKERDVPRRRSGRKSYIIAGRAAGSRTAIPAGIAGLILPRKPAYSHVPFYGKSQGPVRRRRFFCGHFPFCAAEKPEKSGFCTEIAQGPRVGHLVF